MLTQPLKIEQKEQQGFEPLPSDVYQVELLDITSQEKPTYDTRNYPPERQKLETVLNFQFTLLDGKDGETYLRGRNVWANFIPPYLYTSKKSGKNKLYRIIEALIGHDMTMDEYTAMSMDGTKFLNELVGKQCRLVVEQKESKDKVINVIGNYMPAKSLLNALNNEEKEKAKVKKQPQESVTVTEGHPDYIKAEDIPF